MRPEAIHEAYRSEYNGQVSLFECLEPGCRYRATLDHEDGSYAVLDRGDLSARHWGSTGPVSMEVGVG
jgi:hypothetical protein